MNILGVTLDSKMTHDPQIRTPCRLQIRKINSIRKLLTSNAVKALVQSRGIVRLGYCNDLYHGLLIKSIKRLQLAHNSAAKLTTLTSSFEHFLPILKQLLWLPIHKRCRFIILVFLYKVLHISAPPYQCKLLNHQGRSDLPLQHH